MSAYIVSDETINVIVCGFMNYNVSLPSCYLPILAREHECENRIGQKLVEQNYASVNARYNESTEPHTYRYHAPKEYDDGILLGCIKCYNYQAGETADYFTGEIHGALECIKDDMLRKMIREKGMDIPWGVD